MRRLLVSLAYSVMFLLLAAPVASALEPNDGRGWYGPVNDKAITNIAFATLAFFAVFVTLASIAYGRLEKRKHARQAAAKAQKNESAWGGHW